MGRAETEFEAHEAVDTSIGPLRVYLWVDHFVTIEREDETGRAVDYEEYVDDAASLAELLIRAGLPKPEAADVAGSLLTRRTARERHSHLANARAEASRKPWWPILRRAGKK